MGRHARFLPPEGYLPSLEAYRQFELAHRDIITPPADFDLCGRRLPILWRYRLRGHRVRALLVTILEERLSIHPDVWGSEFASGTHWTGKLSMAGPHSWKRGWAFIYEEDHRMTLKGPAPVKAAPFGNAAALPSLRLTGGIKKQRVWNALDHLSAAGLSVETMTPKEACRQMEKIAPGAAHLSYVGGILREWKARHAQENKES